MTQGRLILANQRGLRGFTLVEVLVSLVILSVMAATAWKGMDGITRAREVAEGQLKQTLRLQSVMTQWDADMAAVIDTSTLPGGHFEYDGARLRFTRRAAGGVHVVVWGLRDGQLERWAAPVVTQVGDIEAQWKKSYQLRGKEPGTLVALKGVEQWQVFCFPKAQGQQTSNWANCQGSLVTGGQSMKVPVPAGIRSVLTLGAGSGFAGVATRDAMVAPQAN